MRGCRAADGAASGDVRRAAGHWHFGLCGCGRCSEVVQVGLDALRLGGTAGLEKTSVVWPVCGRAARDGILQAKVSPTSCWWR
jgi:hypothetical protein